MFWSREIWFLKSSVYLSWKFNKNQLYSTIARPKDTKIPVSIMSLWNKLYSINFAFLVNGQNIKFMAKIWLSCFRFHKRSKVLCLMHIYSLRFCATKSSPESNENKIEFKCISMTYIFEFYFISDYFSVECIKSNSKNISPALGSSV